ncbi:hydrogenase maturation nickel metallochaperone HypA [Halothermothrix orenii]|uniref:Hydrogenase maturation factor HypA n=1 Tax=Halothermothrix orenii (strain H 168 / OCM 544 / DSM 9562) TaxID=373903 RepID=B8D1R9_HALOH|nr:hydrogenase maturation nickel metallochaperone HypA [Halothermothrix orenii]ACL69146.1 hydrogenase nickel insertion protein HypA [Halothermothrix orenii H 168]
MSVMGEIFSIINSNVAKYRLKRVTKVVVRVGEMTCLNDEALDFAFQVFAEDTVAEGAELIINKEKARARCHHCGHIFEITYTDKLCPHCQSYSDNIVNGYELYLDKVEGEIDEND